MPPRSRTRAPAPDQMTLDVTTATVFSEKQAQQSLADTSVRLAARFASDDAGWAGSAFGWVRVLPPSSRAKAAVAFVAQAAADAGVDVGPGVPGGRTLNGVPVGVRMSTMWSHGQFVFQMPATSPSVEAVALIGFAPAQVWLWLVPLTQVRAHAKTLSSGKLWVSVDVQEQPSWLGCDGTVSGAFARLQALADGHSNITR